MPVSGWATRPLGLVICLSFVLLDVTRHICIEDFRLSDEA